MIIDMRCRPPFGGFLDPLLCDLYIADNVQGFSSRFGMTAGKAVGERTMETFIREMDEAGVDKAVVPIRYAPGVVWPPIAMRSCTWITMICCVWMNSMATVSLV